MEIGGGKWAKLLLLAALLLALVGGALGTVAFVRTARDKASSPLASPAPAQADAAAWRAYAPVLGTFRAKDIDDSADDSVQPTLDLSSADHAPRMQARYLVTGEGMLHVTLNFETSPLADEVEAAASSGTGDYFVTLPDGLRADLSVTMGEESSVAQGAPVGLFYTHQHGAVSLAGTTHALDERRIYFRVHKPDGSSTTASSETTPFVTSAPVYTSCTATLPLRRAASSLL